MSFVKKLREPSVIELLEEYKTLKEKGEAYKEIYAKATDRQDTKTRLETLNRIIDNSFKASDKLIKVIELYSPHAAKSLRKMLRDFRKRSKKQLGRDYKLDPKLKDMPATLLDEIINDTITIKEQWLGVHERFIHLIFLAVSETFKRLSTRIEPRNPIVLFDSLELHPRIRKVSRDLFLDQHYAQAILEAYKEVNNSVKRKAKLKLEGQKLMAQVFNEKKPIIKLNPLETTSDIDEQQGFMFLFMGAMTGIRNPKAHEIVEQRDPFRTLEYLCFASLLLKRTDEGKII